MTWMRRVLAVLLALVLFLFAVVAVNQEQISLRFLAWHTPTLSVFWWLLISLLLGLLLGLAAPASGAEEDEWNGLPAGAGREDVFYLCGACHSLAIVKQQGLNRAGWDETLVWMVEEQGMPELEADEHRAILDYLSRFYGPDRLWQQQ